MSIAASTTAYEPESVRVARRFFGELKKSGFSIVAGVRAAGGWRAYDRRPRAEVLRLRSLALRRRAVFLPSTILRYDHPYIRSLAFLVQCPPEIAWQILGYWRCQYPVDTQLIDQLGYR